MPNRYPSNLKDKVGKLAYSTIVNQAVAVNASILDDANLSKVSYRFVIYVSQAGVLSVNVAPFIKISNK